MIIKLLSKESHYEDVNVMKVKNIIKYLITNPKLGLFKLCSQT